MPITVDGFSAWTRFEESASMTWALDTVRFRDGQSSLRIMQANSSVIGRIFRSTTVTKGTFKSYAYIPAGGIFNPGLGAWITSTSPGSVGGYLFEPFTGGSAILWRIPHGSAISAWGQNHLGATMIAASPSAFPGFDVWIPFAISWEQIGTAVRVRCFAGVGGGRSLFLLLDALDHTPPAASPLGVLHNFNNNAGTNNMNVDESFIDLDEAA